MKSKKLLSVILAAAILLSFVQVFNLTALADVLYPESTVIIQLDNNGIPKDTSGTGWEYDSAKKVLTLEKGYSFAVDGQLNVAVINYGTIVGGTYNESVSNTGSTNTLNEQGGIIENGTFNGDVNNYHSWNLCTINGGTFYGKVTIGNHAVINNGTFLGEFDSKLLGWTVNAATFKIDFVKNGGDWSLSYTAPTTYSYSASAGIKLPTADDISINGSVFYGWYTDESFSGDPVTQIPGKAVGKLTYYARYIDSDATWELVGEQAVLNTDYSVDGNGNYRIFTAKGLAKLANVVNGGNSLAGKTVTLENNIDLLSGGVTGYSATGVNDLNSWNPIYGFSGTFDGNGKEISNFYASTKNKNAGLFGTTNGTVKKLTIKSGAVNVSSTSSAVCVGAIVALNYGIIEDCTSNIDISVEGSVYAGGIAGYTNTSDRDVYISDCKNYGDISSAKGSNYLGGIVGYQFSGYATDYKVFVENCINEGDISGKFNVGGISGTVKNQSAKTTSLVRNCINKGDVNGDKAGGITGYSEKGYVYNSYNFGSITGGKYGGGIVGCNIYGIAEIANCYNAGTVTATNECGGVAGRVSYGKALNCYYLSNGAIAAVGKFANNGSAADCSSFTATGSNYTLENTVYNTTDLLTALNAWVTAKNDENYSAWVADGKNSNYPTFVKKVEISKEDKSVYYGESTYDVSTLFGIDSNAGRATYSLAEGGTGKGTLSGTALTITKAGSFKIRVTTAANGVYAAGSKDAILTVLPKSVTATISKIPDYVYTGKAIEPTVRAYDGSTEIPTGEYAVEYSENINAGTATVTLIGKDNGNYIVSGSAIFKINKASQAAPSGLEYKAETADGKADGYIKNLTSAMEYRKDNETVYTAINGTELTGLANGVYYIRYRADGNHNASDDTKLVLSSNNTATSPVTGDTDNISIWLVLILAGSGALGATAYRRKRKTAES